MKPYYRILRLNHGRAPTVQHATLKEAETEALRLAVQHPGVTFEILKVIGTARTATPSIFWNDGVEPPIEEPARYPAAPLPEGFDRRECRGFGWDPGVPVTYTTGWGFTKDSWIWQTSADIDRVPNGTGTSEYWEAVKDEPTYRMLGAGERMEEGDEFLVAGSSNQWLKRKLNLGVPWHPQDYTATRRPINQKP